jgi:hypothetical protein
MMARTRTAAIRETIRSSAVARLFLPLAIAAALAAGIATTASPALATTGSSRSASSATPRAFFGLGPASKTKIDGRSYFNWSATPGAMLTDHVAIVNFGTTAVTLRVFVTNAVSTIHGGTTFVPPAKAIGGPADWVRLHLPGHSQIVHLAPRSKIIVPITVTIPRNAPPGDHVGAVIAALTSLIQSKNHAKVHLVQQVADRIIARVSGKLRPRLSVVNLHVAYSDPLSPLATNTATLSFTIRNTGNELLGGNVTVSVHGLLGSTETRSNVVKVPVLLPGGSDSERIQVHGVYPEIHMLGKVSVAPLVVQGQYDQGLSIYTGQAGFWAVPWIALVILILLIAMFAAVWLRRRRWLRSASAAHDEGAARGGQKVEAK